MWMHTDLKKKLGALMLTVFCTLLLLAGVSALLTPVPALAAASDLLEITGDGVTNPATFTLDQLKDMEQRQYVYSCINTWPTKKWYVGKGVKLSDLLAQAGMTQEATLIRFTSVDSYTVTLTVKELFEDKRYRFPNFKNGADGDGHIPGDPSGKVEVEPIVGLVSVEGSDNPKYMNDLNTLLLMMGQRTVTEQTGNLFVKGLHRIEVLTDEPQKWDAPQANPGSGTVPVGSIITLSNIYTDDDKIYYTTDGSIPTMDSPMYNWVARRWWPSRADVLGTINRPIGPINQDTTIKAITIGPGKLDSEVVTFTYKIAGDGDDPKPTAKVIQLTIGKTEASVDGKPYTLDARPYINAEAGRTLVPVRFISEALNAEVAWDPITRQVTIKDTGKDIALTIGSREVKVNGVSQTIDCAPVISPSGRTFVPLRFIIETLEAEVKYDPSNGQILITR
jgi:hypothetical protein